MRVEMWTDILNGFPFQISLLENSKVLLRAVGTFGSIEIHCCVADIIDLSEKIDLVFLRNERVSKLLHKTVPEKESEAKP